MIQLTLQPRRAAAFRAGHPWLFRDEVQELPNPIPDGEEADVLDHRGTYLGRGLLSARSQIVCRLYSRRPEPLDREFFRGRLLEARELRRALGLPNVETDSFREVFAEGDRLPGLTVDRFGEYLVVQTPTAAMDRRKALLVELLEEIHRPAGICERNDMSVRQQEGLPLARGWLSGQPAETLFIRENGLKYAIDPLASMKTGFFLDQRQNRRLLRPLSAGKSVLDLFCFTGSFGLTAAASGAQQVLSVDSSEAVIEAARRNAQLNKLETVEHRAADVFQLLKDLDDEGRQFDVVVLDPPAFAKRKTHFDNAARGYKQINLRALKLLPIGGHLLTCSCSYPIDRTAFRDIVLAAAADARCVLRVLEEGSAGGDHPTLLNVPETDYLKSLLVTVVEKF